MKKIFATMIAAVLAVAASAQADTVKVIENASKVIITEDSLGTHVKVVSTTDGNSGSTYNYTVTHESDDRLRTRQSTSDWNLKFPFSGEQYDSCKVSHWSAIMNGLYVGEGWINASDKGSAFDNSKGHTYEMGILNLVGVEYNTHHGQWFNLGFGIDYSRVSIHDQSKRLYKDENNVLTITDMPAYAEHRSSNLHQFALQFSLMYHQRLYSNLKIFAGPVMRINTGSHVTSSWKIGDDRTTIETEKLGEKKISFDVMGGITWGGLGIYARYRPTDPFKTARGPQYTRFTLGLALGF